MNKVLAIAYNTFKEAIRDKVLYVLVFFSIVVILCSKVFGSLSIDEEVKVIKDLGLSTVDVFGALIAIFIGTSLIYKEIDKRTLYTVLSKPVSREYFIAGKYLGLLLMLFVNVVLMSAGFVIYLYVMKPGSVDALLLKALVLIFIELAMLTAVAIFFSTATTPIVSALLTFAIYVLGNSANWIMWGVYLAREHETHHGAAAGGITAWVMYDVTPWLLNVLYTVVPNFEHFNIKAQAANGIDRIAADHMTVLVGYGISYIAVVLLASVLVFNRKNL